MSLTFIVALWEAIVNKIDIPKTVVDTVQATDAERTEKPEYLVLKDYIVEVTGYSSRVEETDETPFITASGSIVHWGTIATNAYPFGTELRFPDVYGDRIFIVKDKMNSRYRNRMDIWFPDHHEAIRFGKRNLRVEILDTSNPEQLVKR